MEQEQTNKTTITIDCLRDMKKQIIELKNQLTDDSTITDNQKLKLKSKLNVLYTEINNVLNMFELLGS